MAVNERPLDPVVEFVSCLHWKELVRGRPEGIGLLYGVPVNKGENEMM